MISLIQRWSEKVIHGGIDYDKFLVLIRFPVKHVRKERTRRPDNSAAWLKQQMHSQTAQRAKQPLRIFARGHLKIIALRLVICNSQTATRINVVDSVPISAKLADQVSHTFHCGRKGINLANLRSDVNTNASNFQIPVPSRLRV